MRVYGQKRYKCLIFFYSLFSLLSHHFILFSSLLFFLRHQTSHLFFFHFFFFSLSLLFSLPLSLAVPPPRPDVDLCCSVCVCVCVCVFCNDLIPGSAMGGCVGCSGSMVGCVFCFFSILVVVS